MTDLKNLQKKMELIALIKKETNKRHREEDHENKYSVGSQNTLAETNSESLREKITPVDTLKEQQKVPSHIPSPKPEQKTASELDELNKLNKLNQLNQKKTQQPQNQNQEQNQQDSPNNPLSPFKKRPSPFNQN